MKTIHQKIQEWYQKHGRHNLPWRTIDDPYAIWLSEVMLQQTQVDTVLKRFYAPFLKRFPTIESLAKAPLDDVLKMWEGLGYYNRAKNLHKTAQILTKAHKENHSNKQKNISTAHLPSDIDALIKLPGIGKNTAHAIAAFAFRKPVPIMEANVKRILCRLHKIKSPTDKILWKKAYELVDKENPFDYNQAMMDIGATLCTPKNPQCTICPLQKICKGQDAPTLYPEKKRRTTPTKEQNIMISIYNSKLLLVQRSGRFLHGLWGFPVIEVPLCASEYIGRVTHTYTHFKLICNIYRYEELDRKEGEYFTTAQIQKLAISKVDEKILKLYLNSKLTKD